MFKSPKSKKNHLFVHILRNSHVGKIQLTSIFGVGEWQVAHLFKNNNRLIFGKTNQGHLERQSWSVWWRINGKNWGTAGLKELYLRALSCLAKWCT